MTKLRNSQGRRGVGLLLNAAAIFVPLFVLIILHPPHASSALATPNTIFTPGLSLNESTYLFSQHISGPIMDTISNKQSSCVQNKQNLVFGEHFVVREAMRVKKSKISLVSLARLVASLWLSGAALSLPTPGDFVETGVYRGGSSILLIRTLLKFDSCNRLFWGFDSFEGLPASVAEDKVGTLSRGSEGQYTATESTFYANLQQYKAFKNPKMMVITKGFFNETLPVAPITHIAFLRLDGDIFTSTWDALVNLYPKVIPGGYIYVDDYDSFNGCKKAVDAYRLQHKISEPMTKIIEGKRPDQKRKREYEAVWWQKKGA